jgi:hypothetical protein
VIRAGVVTILKENLTRHPSDRHSSATRKLQPRCRQFAVALEYAEQLARVAPNDPSLTLIDNLRHQIRMHDDGEPLTGDGQIRRLCPLRQRRIRGSRIIDKQPPDRCLRWCAGTLSARRSF